MGVQSTCWNLILGMVNNHRVSSQIRTAWRVQTVPMFYLFLWQPQLTDLFKWLSKSFQHGRLTIDRSPTADGSSQITLLAGQCWPWNEMAGWKQGYIIVSRYMRKYYKTLDCPLDKLTYRAEVEAQLSADINHSLTNLHSFAIHLTNHSK